MIHGAITEPTPVGGYLGAVTGKDVVVTATVAGPIGQFGWLVRHEDAADVEASLNATSTSQEYLELLESSGNLFQPGASQVFAQRIA